MGKRLKIAFVSQPFDKVLPPYQNSVGLWIYEVTKILKKSNDLIIYTKQNDAKRDEIIHGIKYEYIPTKLDNRLNKYLRKIPKFHSIKHPLFASRFYYLSYILQIAIDLKKRKCDIVHIMTFQNFIPIIKFFNPNIKIVLHRHDNGLMELDKSVTQKELECADLIMGCSNHVTKEIQNKFLEITGKCKTIYNGVDIKSFSRKNNKKKDKLLRLLYVGRISPEKGVHILLDAFNKIKKTHSIMSLNLIGPCNNSGQLEKDFAAQLTETSKDKKIQNLRSFYNKDYRLFLQKELDSKVTKKSFICGVPRNQLIKYYHKADIFIFPSIWQEAFGIPIIEAMAASTPVIASKTGGIKEIVKNGETGLLIERSNANSLAKAILTLAKNKKLRASFGRKGLQRAIKFFTWEKITKDLLKQYKELVKD